MPHDIEQQHGKCGRTQLSVAINSIPLLDIEEARLTAMADTFNDQSQ